MKSFVLLSAVLASLLIIGNAADASAATNKCITDADKSVNSALVRDARANNLVGGDAGDLSSFIKAQFKTSYKYLLMSTNFNSFIKDRQGFNKLFRAESDKLFEDAISLTKHITSRGYAFDSKKSNEIGRFETPIHVNLDEMTALEKGVQKQKALVKKALNICDNSDKEIQHYFQEKILKDYTQTLRKFSGYYNNLNNFGSTDYKLGVYLFDEYLQKQ